MKSSSNCEVIMVFRLALLMDEVKWSPNHTFEFSQNEFFGKFPDDLSMKWLVMRCNILA